MISSAPARRETKLAIMEHFRNSQLFELYGSTEAGWVTLLRPDEQITKLGSVGREWTGSGADPAARCRRQRSPRRRGRRAVFAHAVRLRRLLEEPGEDGRGVSAARGARSATWRGATRTATIHLVDRKSNMIISGGENIYPSEVEGAARRPPGGEGRRGDRRARRQVGRGGARGGGAARRARPPPKPSCSAGAANASPATSGRAAVVFIAEPRCRARRRARSCMRVLRAKLAPKRPTGGPQARSQLYRPTIASTSAFRKRSTTSMKAIDGISSRSAVIDAIW